MAVTVYYPQFEVCRIAADGSRVALPALTVDVYNVTAASSLGTLVTDANSIIAEGNFTADIFDVIEISHATYPLTCRFTLTETQDEAYTLAENHIAIYIAENLYTDTTESQTARLYLIDLDNPDAAPQYLADLKPGVTTDIPYQTSVSKNVRLAMLSQDIEGQFKTNDVATATETFDITIPAVTGTYQPLDATLTALAGANWAANSLAVGSGSDTVAQVPFAANTFPARSSSGNLVAKTISDDALAFNAAANNAAMRTALGGTTVGQAIFGLTNPSAVTFLRMNADNTVTARSAANFRTDLGIDTDDAVTFGDLTVNNLIVNGSTITVNTATMTVDDPLIRLADNNGADSVDVGFYGVYVSAGTKYTGLFRDASDGKYHLFHGSGTEPTTTVNIGAGGYAVSTLVANIESSNVAITGGSITGITDLTVADGGTGRSTSTTAYGLIAAGTTATGAHQTLAAGATTEILVGGGASALPVWTTATGTGAPVRAASPTFSGTVTTRGISLSGSGGVPDKINFGANSGAAAIYLFDSFPYRLGFGINSSELQSFVPDGNRWTWNKGGDFQASGTNEVARLEAVGNFKIGGTAARGTTEGTNQIVLFNGTPPAGTLTNGGSIFCAGGEIKVADAAGNITQISPHDKEGNWIHSETNYKGRVLRVDMERLVKAIDKLLGGGFVQEFLIDK